jgi:hypothetical protein
MISDDQVMLGGDTAETSLRSAHIGFFAGNSSTNSLTAQ